MSVYIGCGNVSGAVCSILRAPSISSLALLPHYSGILLAAEQSSLSPTGELPKPKENPFYGERLFPFIMGIINITSSPVL